MNAAARAPTGGFDSDLAARNPRVLVVRLSSLGDVILTTPVFENLKAAWPRSHVSVLVRTKYADVLRGHPAVDDVLLFEARGFWGWLGEIRRRSYGVYIDLHDTPRSRLWGLFSGISRRVRYDKRACPRRFLVWFKVTSSRLAENVTERYLGCLSALGIPISVRRPRLFVRETERLSREWEERVGRGPFLGLAPGAQHAIKRWPAERFARAADELMQKLASFSSRGTAFPARILLFGASSDEKAAEEVLAVLRGPVLNLAGKTTSRDLILLTRRCSLFLTNDSGAMHVASVLDVPTVAVFGPTVKAFGFFPKGDFCEVAEVNGLYCRPCSLHGLGDCPEGHFRCMRDVPVEQVVGAALRVYERKMNSVQKTA